MRSRPRRALLPIVLAMATTAIVAPAGATAAEPRKAADCRGASCAKAPAPTGAARQAGATPARKATPDPRAAPRSAFASADEAFLAARQASTRGDAAAFDAAAARVPPDHPLRSYVDHWRLRTALAEAAPDGGAAADDAVRRFLAANDGTWVAELARRDWIRSLGRREQWAAVDAAAAGGSFRDDPAVGCVVLRARLARGEAVLAPARDLLMRPRELPDACHDLLGALAAAGQAQPADLWLRVERAIESGSATAVRRAALLAAPSLDPKRLDLALSRPVASLDAGGSHELTLIALGMLARTDPAEAADRMTDIGTRLRPAERSFVWSQVAASGMRRLAPEAHAWTRAAQPARGSDETLASMARAALRATDWPLLLSVVDRMSEAGQAEPAWTYWRARALQARTDDPNAQHQARVQFTALAGQREFYAQLAAEAVGLRVEPPAPATAVPAAELAEARAHPGLGRAFKLYELGLRPEGHREWNFALRGMTDRQLLAAATLAGERGQLDRMVNTAERTRTEHDDALRYPTPYADRLVPIARAQGIDPAWAYGLIRQESRFYVDARSSAGASGLMQIMPGTARWIARKMGTRGFSPAQINDLDTNLTFGTFYLRTVQDDLDRSPVLASAAYNAGPGRPRSWRGTLPGPVEGAVFAEIIPFNETRGYVKHVLANTAVYAAMFTGQEQSLTALLGQVQPGPPVPATASPGGD
jgi:soluble lytic murein transglycosylase